MQQRSHPACKKLIYFTPLWSCPPFVFGMLCTCTHVFWDTWSVVLAFALVYRGRNGWSGQCVCIVRNHHEDRSINTAQQSTTEHFTSITVTSSFVSSGVSTCHWSQQRKLTTDSLLATVKPLLTNLRPWLAGTHFCIKVKTKPEVAAVIRLRMADQMESKSPESARKESLAAWKCDNVLARVCFWSVHYTTNLCVGTAAQVWQWNSPMTHDRIRKGLW